MKIHRQALNQGVGWGGGGVGWVGVGVGRGGLGVGVFRGERGGRTPQNFTISFFLKKNSPF